MFTKVKTDDEIRAIRESGKMLATVLKSMRENAKVGVTQKDLAAIAASELKAMGGKPAFYNYQGFPDVICISSNDEVVHGIPSNEELKDGDIIGFDFGVNYKGMITDSAITVPVGNVSEEVAKLVSVTKDSLHAGINTLKDGVRTGDIGEAIERVLKANNYGIVRELVGHGVGHHVHEEPNIPNYGKKGTGNQLRAGMTIAIEPMVTLGEESIGILEDGWTVVTRDGSMSAHFEHTVLITETSSEILTKL